MKRFIVFFAIMALIIAMFGCAVNSTTGGITVLNKTSAAVNNVKVGTVNIGYIAAGATSTVYFTTLATAAQISADGFTASGAPTSKGTIDLKLNYLYALNLTINNTGNVFAMNGYKVGGKTTDSDYMIDMQ
jgi:hypothetical protein